MYAYALSNKTWSLCNLYFNSALRNDFCTSLSPEVVVCHPGKFTTRTMASISLTMRSTTAGVSSVLSSRNNSVRAALGDFSCSSCSNSFSAATVSLAILQSSLTNSIEVISPFSALSLSSSSRSLSFLNLGLSPCFLNRLMSIFSSFFAFLGSGLLKISSITSASSTNSSKI